MTASQAQMMAVTREGKAARAAGHKFEDCPYGSDALLASAWEAGWTRGTRMGRDDRDTAASKDATFLF